jgi:hypothetical protein
MEEALKDNTQNFNSNWYPIMEEALKDNTQNFNSNWRYPIMGEALKKIYNISI